MINPPVRRLLAGVITPAKALDYIVLHFNESPPTLALQTGTLRVDLTEDKITARFTMPESRYHQPDVPGFRDRRLPDQRVGIIEILKHYRENYLEIVQLQSSVDHLGRQMDALVLQMRRRGLIDENARRQQLGPAENLQQYNPINLRTVHEVSVPTTAAVRSKAKINPAQIITASLPKIRRLRKFRLSLAALDQLSTQRFHATLSLVPRTRRALEITPRMLQLAGDELGRSIAAEVIYRGAVLTDRPNKGRENSHVWRVQFQHPIK